MLYKSSLPVGIEETALSPPVVVSHSHAASDYVAGDRLLRFQQNIKRMVNNFLSAREKIVENEFSKFIQ